jgi:hypothetical protein
LSGIKGCLKGDRANGLLILVIGIILIVAGFAVGLYSFSVAREQAAEPDVPGMFSAFGLGIIIAIILVAAGCLIIIFGLRSG